MDNSNRIHQNKRRKLYDKQVYIQQFSQNIDQMDKEDKYYQQVFHSNNQCINQTQDLCKKCKSYDIGALKHINFLQKLIHFLFEDNQT
ncbi:unnamed protein product [Paramecium sonneborni]|uniref:Uncharacterized protein n=1 Tax=Paramecium sonneborni TaxID=65129 RepID=A0A8S1MXE4_9CILI|nr:unnamed protein product [Paramecium sonneborni]